MGTPKQGSEGSGVSELCGNRSQADSGATRFTGTVEQRQVRLHLPDAPPRRPRPPAAPTSPTPGQPRPLVSLRPQAPPPPSLLGAAGPGVWRCRSHARPGSAATATATAGSSSPSTGEGPQCRGARGPGCPARSTAAHALARARGLARWWGNARVRAPRSLRPEGGGTGPGTRAASAGLGAGGAGRRGNCRRAHSLPPPVGAGRGRALVRAPASAARVTAAPAMPPPRLFGGTPPPRPRDFISFPDAVRNVAGVPRCGHC